MRFDPAYREEVTLKGETAVTLRLVRPDDKAGLQRSLSRLSGRSRQLRFLGQRASAFSEPELAYLTEVDAVDHVAIVALVAGEIVGVGRLVRNAGDRGLAEPAFTVLDAYQGLGLGRVLLARVVDAALERGIVRFEATMSSGNRAMMRLFRELSPALTSRRDYAYVVLVDIPMRHSPSVRSLAA
jgi:GNAT superfamily N-acetyltransferase